ncbi:hypothetical protein AB5I41_15390 [Sphingomonas sp. MMS24-JH45]
MTARIGQRRERDGEVRGIGVALAIAILVSTFVGYRHWTEKYQVTRTDDGLAVARVIADA